MELKVAFPSDMHIRAHCSSNISECRGIAILIHWNSDIRYSDVLVNNALEFQTLELLDFQHQNFDVSEFPRYSDFQHTVIPYSSKFQDIGIATYQNSDILEFLCFRICNTLELSEFDVSEFQFIRISDVIEFLTSAFS